MAEQFLNDRIALHCGDMRTVLATLPECSIDSCVTDPPYHLTSIVKRFGVENATPPKSYKQQHAFSENWRASGGGTGEAFARMSRGFMGKVWDGGDIAFDPATWRVVYRVLKPGAHLLAMGGTRTFHRLACAIEDAGFEVRDTISWLYGSGFPKSHDMSKGIDRAAGAEREIVGRRHDADKRQFGGKHPGWDRPWMHDLAACERHVSITAPATDAARQWEGWGTALKPACELIVLARKPLSEGTVAGNVLRWGTGAINVDGCRVGTETIRSSGAAAADLNTRRFVNGTRPRDYEADKEPSTHIGRWPANVVHDGSEEVVAGFPDAPGQQYATGPQYDRNANVYGKFAGVTPAEPRGDSGSAARFFYTAKADSDDRLGSKHPTVKPLDLMQWLVRLVCPKGGTVLDPFAGTGTTGEAAWREGMSIVLIEAEPEYQADIRRRMALALAGPDERAREAIKAKNLPRDDGPLFSWDK
jgi:DNA modification methylase